MKKYLAWVKQHLVFVFLMVVALLAFPVMFFVSSGMKAKNRETVENDLRAQSNALNALNVSYAVEPVFPGAPGFTATRPPNTATTEALKGLIAQSVDQVERATQAVQTFNRNTFKPVVEGLFPKPADTESVAKRDAMARQWVGWNAQMLNDAGAGQPPAADEVARRVEEKRLREVDRLLGVSPDPAAITPEVEQEIRDALVKERLAAYSAPAQQRVLFYATPSVLTSVAPYTGTNVPELELCWEWQWVSWVNQMIVEGIAAANSNDLAVAYAPVKRVERIEVEPFAYPGAGRQPATDATQEIPLSFASALSGRAYNPEQPNALYDVRYATVQLIVASRRIPEILDAFARSNLITAVDLDVAAVEDLEDLASAGYSFGSDHVVRVHLRLETLWLRAWTREFMPPVVRARLGVEPPEGQQNEDPAGTGGATQSNERAPATRGRQGPGR